MRAVLVTTLFCAAVAACSSSSTSNGLVAEGTPGAGWTRPWPSWANVPASCVADFCAGRGYYVVSGPEVFTSNLCGCGSETVYATCIRGTFSVCECEQPGSGWCVYASDGGSEAGDARAAEGGEGGEGGAGEAGDHDAAHD
jgi:hypothetical protein